MPKTKKEKLIKMMEKYVEQGICKITNQYFLADRILEALNNPEEQQIEEIPVTKTFGRVKMNEMIRAINKLNDLN